MNPVKPNYDINSLWTSEFLKMMLPLKSNIPLMKARIWESRHVLSSRCYNWYFVHTRHLQEKRSYPEYLIFIFLLTSYFNVRQSRGLSPDFPCTRWSSWSQSTGEKTPNFSLVLWMVPEFHCETSFFPNLILLKIPPNEIKYCVLIRRHFPLSRFLKIFCQKSRNIFLDQKFF